jgi:PAS domain S-box-containing protein
MEKHKHEELLQKIEILKKENESLSNQLLELKGTTLDEEALMMNPEIFRSFIRQMPFPLCHLDTTDGSVKFLNKKFTEVLGYTIEDMPSQEAWWDLAYPDMKYREWVLNNWAKAVEKASVNNSEILSDTYKVRCKDGSYRFVNIGGITLGNDFVITLIDLTEQKKYEEELKVKSHALEERVKEMNCLLSITKLTEREEGDKGVIFRDLVLLIPAGWQYPEICCAKLIIEDETYKTPNFKETEWQLKTEIIINDKKYGALTVGYLEKGDEDVKNPFIKEEKTLLERITDEIKSMLERRQWQAELYKSEKQFREVFDNSPLGKSMTGVDGSLNLNKRFCEILGYSAEEIQNTNWKDITHPDDVQESARIVNSIIEGKISHANFEKRYIHKDGHIVWTDVNTSLQRDADGNPMYFITTISDISERKRIEKDVLRQRNVAESTIESVPGVFYQISKEGRFVRTNKHFENVSKYSAEEFTTLHPLELFNDEEKEKVGKAIEEVFVNGCSEVEANLLSKDGTSTPHLFTGRLFTIDKEPYLIGMGLDISNLKKVESNLQKTNTELEVFNKMAVGREKQMIKLKKRINELSEQLGQEPPYDIGFAGE